MAPVKLPLEMQKSCVAKVKISHTPTFSKSKQAQQLSKKGGLDISTYYTFLV